MWVEPSHPVSGTRRLSVGFARRYTAVDVHAEGEPGRVIVDGVDDPPGNTMLAKAQWLEAHADEVRLRMLREPSGYPALCCNIVLPPCDPQADAGFVIMEQTEYAPMSGSNTMCVVTALLETGRLPMVEPITDLTLETPAGIIGVRARCTAGKVTNVAVRNVPSFVMALDLPVEVPGLGTVPVDIAWGGMFFAIADGDALGVDLSAANGAQIARVSEMIRVATREQHPVAHPLEPSLTGPSIGQLHGAATQPHAHGRNAVTVASGAPDWDRPESWKGALDRCPCGTGTSARMAVLHARGELGVDEAFVYEGPLGTTFTGRVLEETIVGERPAIIPEISGQAWITAFAEYVVDDTDPFPEGFTVGDLWP